MYTSELPEYLLELITTQAVKAKREALSIAEFNYRESASRAIDTRVAANIIRKYARIFKCNHSMKTVVSSINVSYHPFTNLGFVDPLGEVLHYADHVLVNAQGRMTAYFTS